jgi:LacI family transcriptional regulator
MKPNLTDIAKEAGVSTAAVSFALNNKKGVSAEQREKILSIALKMGYSRIITGKYSINDKVRVKFLKIAKHGHIVNDQHNAFITEYIEGIEIGARKRHYKVEVSFFNKIPVEDIVKTQRDVDVDGFVVLGTELNAHELSCFSQITKPLVFIDTYFPFAEYHCIDIDNFDGVFRAIEHFYRQGHRSIGLIKSRFETRNSRMRELGFLEAMEYFSLPVQEKYILSVDPTISGVTEGMRKFLKKNSPLPTAFFCINDIIAYGSMAALNERGRRIPEDVSIIGFDDLPSSILSHPPLTTIRVATRSIGERALDKLADRIADIPNDPPENILIAGKFIPRDSVRSYV